LQSNRERGKERGMVKKSPIIAVKKAVQIAGNQSKLAKAAGCGQQTISDIINGKRSLSVEIAIKISKATGVPRTELRPDVFDEAA
jgi:DNA-binding transcriptional regulator YdaS (Cro superfamily)